MEKDSAYYNSLFGQHSDMSRYIQIYEEIGRMTQRTTDIGCGLAELRNYVKDYRGFDFSDVAIKDKTECFLGDVYDASNYTGDVFTATEVLEHVDDTKVINNIPIGKRFIFSVPSFPDPAHLRTYTEERVRGLLGLDIKSITRFGWESKWVKDSQKDPYILLVDSVRVENRELTVTAVMIVKNEEALLAKCLDSIKGLDLVICDTGSTDKTIEIAKKYTDQVYTDYKWNDNFAEARNHALSKAKGDWILIIDADEVLEGTVDEVMSACKNAKTDLLNFTVFDGIEQEFQAIRLHKNLSDIKWVGAIHNHLNKVATESTDLRIKFGYSPAHKLDPDRAFRILKKEVKKGRPREHFYLAREYVYRKDWEKAIHWYEKYLSIAKWKPEICEAYFQIARSWWNLAQGEKARNACLQAIKGNPNFKEALNLMATMSWEREAKVWKKFAEIADNTEVLFIRK